MENFKQMLKSAGIICFGIALFQVVIGFSPSLSLYFGAPEALVKNIYALIFISFLVAGISHDIWILCPIRCGVYPKIATIKTDSIKKPFIRSRTNR